MRRTKAQPVNRLDKLRATARESLNSSLDALIKIERTRAKIKAYRDAASMVLFLPRDTPEQDAAALDLYNKIKAKADELSRALNGSVGVEDHTL